MKKIFYTLSFVAFFTLVTQAQSKPQTVIPAEQAVPVGERINADGTQVKEESKRANDNVKQDVPKDGTRMAITEKGLPASKNKQKDTKEVKATELKQAPKIEKQ